MKTVNEISLLLERTDLTKTERQALLNLQKRFRGAVKVHGYKSAKCYSQRNKFIDVELSSSASAKACDMASALVNELGVTNAARLLNVAVPTVRTWADGAHFPQERHLRKLRKTFSRCCVKPTTTENIWQF